MTDDDWFTNGALGSLWVVYRLLTGIGRKVTCGRAATLCVPLDLSNAVGLRIKCKKFK